MIDNFWTNQDGAGHAHLIPSFFFKSTNPLYFHENSPLFFEQKA